MDEIDVKDLAPTKLSELGTVRVGVTRVKAGHATIENDDVVQEHPVALVYNGISHAVMMATPKDIELFAKGFSLSEGIIDQLSELYALEIIETKLGIQVEMQISTRAFVGLKAQRRAMVGRTGCGVCGTESLEQFNLQLKKIEHTVSEEWFAQIPKAMQQLKHGQPISAKTGGAHAAAWVENGEIVAVFEDVGRHNALDKLLGFIATRKCDVREGFVIMTSRASYELIRKCAAFNIGLLATISAPTSLAIEMAKSANLVLASFCRESGFVIYH